MCKINFRVSQSLKSRINNVAEQCGIDTSTFIRNAYKKFYKNRIVVHEDKIDCTTKDILDTVITIRNWNIVDATDKKIRQAVEYYVKHYEDNPPRQFHSSVDAEIFKDYIPAELLDSEACSMVLMSRI